MNSEKTCDKYALSAMEDSSDDFFQSEHINKRKIDIERDIIRRKKESIIKLENGLKKIKISYVNQDWKDEKEHLFLEFFSKLDVDKAFYQDEYMYGYFLSDSDDNRKCFYNLKSDRFWIDYDSIWKNFEKQFNMNYVDVKLLMNDMLNKHIKLHEETIEKFLLPISGQLNKHINLHKKTDAY